MSSVFSVVRSVLPHRNQLISRAVFAPISTLSRLLGISDCVAEEGMRPAMISAKVCGRSGSLSGSA